MSSVSKFFGMGKKTSTSGIDLQPTFQGGFEDSMFGHKTSAEDLEGQRQSINAIQTAIDNQVSAIQNDPSLSDQEKADRIANDNGINIGKARLADAQNSLAYDKNSSQGSISDIYNQINNLTSAGPGQSDVARSTQSGRDLSTLLQQYSQNGGLPSGDDINNANSINNNLFAPRDVALKQSFLDQTTQANQQAAAMGRSVNDPVLQAKLRTGFLRQQDALSAEKQANAQSLALSIPGNRVNAAQGNFNVNNAMATQAFQNRTNLLGIGNNLATAERAFRVSTSPVYNTQPGGGLASAIGTIGSLAGTGFGIYSAATANPISFFGNTNGNGASSFGGGGGSNASGTGPGQFSLAKNPFGNG